MTLIPFSLIASHLVAFYITLPIIVLYFVSKWIVYTKAGKPGWACLIPIYRTIVLLEIIGKPWWWLLMFFIPVVNIVFAIWMYNMLSKSFGQSEGFTVGLILLKVIFFAILAFSKEITYQGPYGIGKTTTD